MTPSGARYGFTLFELLVVTAILSVLAGILVGAVGQAQRRAMVGADIETLRQLGQAAALYREEHGTTSWPSGCPQLVSAGLVPQQMCAGRADGSRRGLANLISTPVHSIPTPNYKNSFVGYGVLTRYGWESLLDLWPDSDGYGWLADVSTVDWEYGPGRSPVEGSPYRRLMHDGSVQARRAIRGPNRSYAPASFLLDIRSWPEWLEER